jgi:hypothetical protein
LLSLGITSIPEEALCVLEGRNAGLVGVYRDLMARRKAWASRVETYRGEWARSNEAVEALQQRLDEAERARRCSASEVTGKGEGRKRGGAEDAAAKVVALQTRAGDLRVDIEALKTAKVCVRVCCTTASLSSHRHVTQLPHLTPCKRVCACHTVAICWQELKLSNGDLAHEIRVLQGSIEQSEEMTADKRERLKAVVFDRDAFRAKHDALVNGRLHEKLTDSVSALQLALLVLSKERQWNILVEDGVKLQVEAAERRLAAEADKEVADAKVQLGRGEREQKGIAEKESKGE